MNRTQLALAFVALVVAWHLLKGYIPIGENTMVFRGQTFHLSKYYLDYDDYKNDPHNLREDEIPRIEKIMRETKIGPTFKNLDEFNKATGDLVFPGYGSGNIVGNLVPWIDLTGDFVEIPGRDEFRYFIVRKEGDHYRLIDDFVTPPGTALIRKVKLEGTALRYYSLMDNLIREMKPVPKTLPRANH